MILKLIDCHYRVSVPYCQLNKELLRFIVILIAKKNTPYANVYIYCCNIITSNTAETEMSKIVNPS